MNLRAFSRMVQQAAVKPLSQFCRYVPRGRKLAGPAGGGDRMAVESAIGAPRGAGLKLRAGLRDVFAGTVCSVLSIAYCLSYAALIFSGPLSRWLSYGIAVTFLSAAVAAAIVAWRSSLPFAIAGPDTSTSAVTATLVAALVARLVNDGASHLLEPALIVM